MSKEHIWQCAFYKTDKTWCPFCRKRKPLASDKLSSRKDLVSELDRTKNEAIKPKDVDTKSQAKLWWKCEVASDHVWQASVYSRAQNGSGCPFCSNHKVALSNSLAGQYSELAAQFHLKKNAPLRPEEISGRYKKRVWWVGPCGHEWLQTVEARTIHARGCSICARLSKLKSRP